MVTVIGSNDCRPTLSPALSRPGGRGKESPLPASGERVRERGKLSTNLENLNSPVNPVDIFVMHS